MKTKPNSFIARTSVAALCATLFAAALAPWASAADEDDAVKALTQPSSTVEVGGGYVSDDSFKAGEYNGLEDKGGYAIGQFDLEGGSRYDSGSTTRWRLLGSNLGLAVREVSADYAQQGNFRLIYDHNEIQRNYSDSYKVLFDGAGSSTLTLPAAYLAAGPKAVYSATQLATIAADSLSNWNNIQSPYATAACATTGGTPVPACQGPGYLLPQFMKGFELQTHRTLDGLTLGKQLASGWEFKASARREAKDGAKLTGVNMNRFTGPSALLPEPIDSTTDLFEATASYINSKGHLRIGYNGSFYNNDTNLWTAQYAGVTASNPLPGNIAHLSGAPDNSMNQINLVGGYHVARNTQLTVNGAYTRMWQNESFLDTPAGATWVLPETSAHAKVINSFFTAKLTSRPASQVDLNFAYKFDHRDNRTPIHDFLVTPDVSGASTQFTNEPINRRLQQVNIDANYALTGRQGIKAGYEWQQIERTADGDESPFRAERTRENTLSAEYHNEMSEKVTGRLSYAYSQRRHSPYEEGDPQPTSPPAPLPAADPLLPGFHQFFLADRNRHRLRGTADYQMSASFDLQTGLAYNKDDYSDSLFGLKEARSWSVDLDGTYEVSEKLSLSAYYTYEDMRSKLQSYAIARGLSTSPLVPHTACTPFSTSGTTALPADYFQGDPCRDWSETQLDRVHTFGLGVASRDLRSGKLRLTGDVAFSYAQTPIDMTGGSYYSNGLTAAGSLNNVFVPAGSLPDTTAKMLDVNLSGEYQLNKASAVRLGYRYRYLRSADWQYDAYANSALGVIALQGYIGPGITAPRYSEHIVGVTYIYRLNL